jgi:hypothetical protein
MQIGINYLLEVPHLDEMQIQIDMTNTETSPGFSVKDGGIVKHDLVTKSFLHERLSKQVNKVTIIPTEDQFFQLIGCLREKFPHIFPQPTNKLSLRQLDIMTMMHEEMNKYSSKKRYIYLLQEIVSERHPVTKKRKILFPYLMRLDPKTVGKIMKKYSEIQKLECLETEKGILIVTISRNQQDTLNTIMAATDLVARLEKYFQLDVAYEVQEAIDKFKNNMPRLVVFGNYKFQGPGNTEEINAKARYTYLELRNMDIYMKSLFINQVNLEENREKLAKEILKAYNQPYSIKKAEGKLPLKDGEKKKLLNLLEKLNKYYSKEDYLKLSIQIKCLEPIYHVSYLKSQLENIYKLHSFTAK